MQTFNLDLSVKRVIPLMYAKQRNAGMKILVRLTDNKEKYTVPDGVTWSVWYSGANGEGNYDKIDSRDAVVVDAEAGTATVELIYQMLDNPGPGEMCLVMNSANGTQLGLWNIPYFVEAIPGADSKAATVYYQAFLNAQKKSEDAAAKSEAAAGRSEAAAEDAEKLLASTNETLSNVKGEVFYQTDNLLDFQTAGFWVNEDFDGKSVSYTMSTAEKIPVKGGSELYTAMKGLSTDVLGTAFLMRVREYNDADEVVVAQTTYSTISSTGVTHYTLNESTTKIAILLTTNDWKIGITPELFIEMDPLIYAGFNSSITRDTVYRKQGSNMERLDEELDGLKAIIGEPLAGMIPSPLGTPYPDIDTNAKTFTLYQDTVLHDRRLANGWHATASTIVYDYSALTTSAIYFCWDIVNATVKAFAYNATLDNAKYIPICMLRTNKNAVASAIPIRVNGLWFGIISEDKINQGSIWKNDNVKGINHRGDTKTAPENTLPAFKVSKENGFFGVETDVRFTSDGVAVLLHDDTINRTARNADGSELATAINISDITYEEALTYDFGVWKSSAYAGTPIPTFEQFLRICRKLGLHPYIELKVGTQEQIEGLADAVIRNGMKSKVTWISYNAGMLESIKAHTSSARLGFLVDAWDAGVIETLTALKNEDNEVFLDLCDPVTDDIVNSLIAADIPLEVYSNGDYSTAVADPYITGVTTDSSNPGESMYKYLMSGI